MSEIDSIIENLLSLRERLHIIEFSIKEISKSQFVYCFVVSFFTNALFKALENIFSAHQRREQQEVKEEHIEYIYENASDDTDDSSSSGLSMSEIIERHTLLKND
jgi:hypothetical protein